ncbi:hypothetical protein SK128_020598 [Halocaridina rubra]|uniref:Uncharacterized protein n=1 Tax=Halocaridina rubra TaxID=373956 RepID=A0AAN8XH84_HALRR
MSTFITEQCFKFNAKLQYSRWNLYLSDANHRGTAEVKEWSLLMYGTETEPGQAAPTLSGELEHPVAQPSDPAHHQVVDTTEGKTETRDPGTQIGHQSSSAASSPTPQPIQLLPLVKSLPPGCSRTDASGLCIGLCLVVILGHMVVGHFLLNHISMKPIAIKEEEEEEEEGEERNPDNSIYAFISNRRNVWFMDFICESRDVDQWSLSFILQEKFLGRIS